MKLNPDLLPYLLSEQDAQQLTPIFDDFAENTEIETEAQERILTSVMRKAGFTMNEKQTKPKIIKRSRIVLISAAAAALLLTTITAVGMTARLTKEEAANQLMGTGAASFLEENDVSGAQKTENPHFRVYLDSLSSDGHIAKMMFCFEALDETGIEQLKNGPGAPDFMPYYLDTGEDIMFTHGSSESNSLLNDERHVYVCRELPLYQIDLSRPVGLRFKSGTYFWDVDDPNPADGLTLKVDLSANLETMTVVNESGTALLLSPLGLSAIGPEKEMDSIETKADTMVVLLYDDGSERIMSQSQGFRIGRTMHNVPEDPLYGQTELRIGFGSLTEIGSCTGVRIGDQVFYAEISE
ncbi:MAG: hypothetical protein IJN11_02990 [Oscillospiraceae bacterium]|nr:hypothetical protein [Oscillospiraceae bacterium]